MPTGGGTRAQRSPRIGVIGADLPRQIVLAAGAVPQRLFGAWSGAVSSRASELLGAVDAVAGRILDDVLAGVHDDLAGLVVCNDSQANLRMFYVLRVLSDRGEIPFPVQLLDAPRGRGEPRRAFVIEQYARLAEFCGRVTGAVVDEASLQSAGIAERRVAAALERLRARRVEGCCAGAIALRAYRAAATSEPDAAVAAIDEARTPQAEGEGERIFITGSAHPDDSVYVEIERTGARVVGEDHDTGDAGWFAASVSGGSVSDTLADLAAMHAARPPSAARSLTAERITALRRRVEATGSTAVLGLVRDLDDAPAWELPAFRHACDDMGVRFGARVQIAVDDALAAAKDAVAALALKDEVHP